MVPKKAETLQLSAIFICKFTCILYIYYQASPAVWSAHTQPFHTSAGFRVQISVSNHTHTELSHFLSLLPPNPLALLFKTCIVLSIKPGREHRVLSYQRFRTIVSGGEIYIKGFLGRELLSGTSAKTEKLGPSGGRFNVNEQEESQPEPRLFNARSHTRVVGCFFFNSEKFRREISFLTQCPK